MPLRPITLADLADLKEVNDLQLSPDGELIAFMIADTYKEQGGAVQSRIWLVPAAGGVARPFTGGPNSDESPRWSPDGTTLAFLSDRQTAGKAQLYLIARDGGEARRLTDLPGGLAAPAWSPDGRQIAFLLDDSESEAEQQQSEASGGVIEYEQHHHWRRIWVVDVASGATRCVTSGEVQVWEFCWAPDGGFVLVAGAEPYEWSWFTGWLAQVGPDGGTPQPLYRAPEKQFACPRVSPDGTRLAFLSAIWSDRGMNGGDVLLLDLQQGSGLRDQASAVGGQGAALQAHNLTQGYAGSIWWMAWTPDSQALDYMAYEDGDATIGRLDTASRARSTAWRGAVAFDEEFAARYAANGRLAVIRSDASTPPEVWVAQLTDQQPADQETGDRRQEAGDRRQETGDRRQEAADSTSLVSGRGSRGSSPLHPRTPSPVHIGDWQRLTNLHPQAAEFALGETRVVRWAGADGLAIQGILILPVGYQAGQQVPLITWVHGGPAWLYTQRLYASGWLMQQVMAAAGYAVLLPNPRGSVGWGVPFTEANIGDYGGHDYHDIIAGVDHVIGLGIADAGRLGIGGWSYGGYIAAWAITQTERFKAAVVGAAITNWRSFHGAATIGTWDQIGLRANPYELGGRYDQRSPISFVSRVRTPALILHGADDTIVPLGQAYELFRALKDLGVPVEMAIYPREGHGLRERLHQQDRFRRYLGWFQRYL